MFQSNGFQTNAFQSINGTSSPSVALLGGKAYSYKTPYTSYREEEYQKQKIAEQKNNLRLIEQQIAEAERKRLEALAESKRERLARKAAKELAALEAMLQGEINRLRIARAWLIRRIDDEEAILILIMRKRRLVF